jgi:DNA-3-methyladenine glycosylase II
VLFHSPYEAATWGIIQARRGMAQAQALRRRLAEEHGTVFDLEGEGLAAFPLPQQLLGVRSLPGLEPLRLRRLHAVAEAALEGRLDPERLKALGPDAARTEMRGLPGIGEFYSGLITVRAVGFADALAVEPRSLAAIGRLYDLPSLPTPEQFESMAEAWRPFRTWAMVLFRYADHREGSGGRAEEV